MKVLMLCDYPYGASEIFGGTSSAAYHLVQSLLKHTDIGVTTFSFWPGCKAKEFREDAGGRLRIHRLPRNEKMRGLINYAPMRRQFRQVVGREKPDILHAQGEGIYASIAVNSDLPNVFTVHGVRLRELDMQRAEIGSIRYFLRSRLIKDCHRKATNVIAINQYTKDYIDKYTGLASHIIRNAISEDFFQLYSPGEVEPGRILLVGGIRRRKDILTALRAFKQVLAKGTSARMSITGPEEEGYTDEVRRFIAENDLAEQVTVHGLVSIEALHDIYRSADVFLLSSREESSPISIVEAMGAGKPIVSTDVGGIAETVAEGRNGLLVQPRDHTGLAQALVKIIRDRELRDKMGAESHRLAVAEWSAKYVALKTFQLYKEMINNS